MSAINDLISEFNNMCGHRTEMAEKAIEEYAALKARAENAEALKDVLLEVVGWISNWEPDFTNDPEWEETEKRIDAAMKAGAK